MNILCAISNDGLRASVAECLQHEGDDIATEASPKEVLQRINDGTFDAVVVNLNDGWGLVLLKVLKGLPRHASMPAFMIDYPDLEAEIRRIGGIPINQYRVADSLPVAIQEIRLDKQLHAATAT